jgi:hypothetical protein
MEGLIPLQEGQAIEVFTQLKIKVISVHGYNLLTVRCRNTHGNVMPFIMIGKENCIKLLKNFKVGDSVNIVSEGGVCHKFTKGIDVEV